VFAYCPELKGCHTQGETVEEALTNLREAAERIGGGAQIVYCGFCADALKGKSSHLLSLV